MPGHQIKGSRDMASRALAHGADWKKRVSGHAAGALLLFTLLLVMCFGALAEKFGSPLVSLAGVVIVGGLVVPALGRLEARWHAEIDTLRAGDIAAQFRMRCTALWLGALVMPVGLAGGFLGLFQIGRLFA